MLHNRYHVVNKLVHGTYSTIWLARDTIASTYVAIKICMADSGGESQEKKLLRRLRDYQDDEDRVAMMPRLLDEFEPL